MRYAGSFSSVSVVEGTITRTLSCRLCKFSITRLISFAKGSAPGFRSLDFMTAVVRAGCQCKRYAYKKRQYTPFLHSPITATIEQSG
jgi:hypothetical protein